MIFFIFILCSKILSSSLVDILLLSKTTSPQKMFPSQFITLSICLKPANSDTENCITKFKMSPDVHRNWKRHFLKGTRIPRPCIVHIWMDYITLKQMHSVFHFETSRFFLKNALRKFPFLRAPFSPLSFPLTIYQFIKNDQDIVG